MHFGTVNREKSKRCVTVSSLRLYQKRINLLITTLFVCPFVFLCGSITDDLPFQRILMSFESHGHSLAMKYIYIPALCLNSSRKRKGSRRIMVIAFVNRNVKLHCPRAKVR